MGLGDFFSDVKSVFTDPKGGGIGSNNNGGGILGFKRKYLDPIGDPLNIFGNMKSKLEDYASGQQSKDVKAAYDQAMANSKANAQQMMDFYNQREARAQGFYAPMQQMFNNTYGSGMQGPQVPKAAGSPLASMFGGTK